MVFVPFSSSTSPQFSTPTLVSHFDVLSAVYLELGAINRQKKKEKKTEMFSVFFFVFNMYTRSRVPPCCFILLLL